MMCGAIRSPGVAFVILARSGSCCGVELLIHLCITVNATGFIKHILVGIKHDDKKVVALYVI